MFGHVRVRVSVVRRASKRCQAPQNTRSFARRRARKLAIDRAAPSESESSVVVRKLIARPLLFTGSVCVGSFATAAYLDRTQDPRGGETLLASIIGLNALVTIAWTWTMTQGLETGHKTLQRWFLHHPFSGRSLPLLLCTFSHSSKLHLCFNMIALWNFGGLMLPALGKYLFCAFYASSGVLTSFFSLCISLKLRRPNPSLGASGALFALAGATASAFPELSFSLIVLEPVAWALGLPSLAIPAQGALAGLMLIDCAGLYFRWRTFDHAAHLAGALIGVGYVKLGVHTAVRSLMDSPSHSYSAEHQA